VFDVDPKPNEEGVFDVPEGKNDEAELAGLSADAEVIPNETVVPNGVGVPNEAVVPNDGVVVELMDETAAGANDLGGLPAPNPNGEVLGTIAVEADGKLKPPLPNKDGAGVGVDDVNAKLFGIVKVLVVEGAGNELVVVVVIAGVGVTVEELNKFEGVAVFVVIDEAEVLGINVNPSD